MQQNQLTGKSIDPGCMDARMLAEANP